MTFTVLAERASVGGDAVESDANASPDDAGVV